MARLPDPNDFETVLYKVQDYVATICLNRPERRNALNRRAYEELEASFHLAQADTDVRAVIVTGADPAFCSGEDVKDVMTAPKADEARARLRAVHPEPTPAGLAMLTCDRPIIAAVNGAAVGWGMEIALFADIRIASETARFGEIFVKRGLVTDMGGIWRLPAIVGPEKAAELVFTGDIIDANEALRIGLVSQVVLHEELIARARNLAARIASNPPLAVRYLKEGLRRFAYGDVHEVGSWVSGTLGVLFETEDHKEGVASFLEKRAPIFKGR